VRRYNEQGLAGMRNRQYPQSHPPNLLLSPAQLAELAIIWAVACAAHVVCIADVLPQHAHEPREHAEPERATGVRVLARLWLAALASCQSTGAPTLIAILVFGVSRVSPHAHTMAYLSAVCCV
jgi:hypothetical protein